MSAALGGATVAGSAARAWRASLAVRCARIGCRLPYHHAQMWMGMSDGWIEYRSRRDDGAAAFVGCYRPAGPAFRAVPGTLECFLVEHYALYVVLRNGSILRADIHHPPWRIQPAEALIERNTVATAAGISLPDREPLRHFAARKDTLAWPPQLTGERRISHW